MTPEPGARAGGRRLPKWLLPTLGYAISLASLVWVYYGFDWRGELPKLLATDWRWITIAVIADIAVYCCQGFRWNLLLSPLAQIPVSRTIQAIYIGLFANEVLPFRSGEVIRCYLQARWSDLPFSLTVTSAIIERLFDGIWLMLSLLAVAQFLTLPRILVEGSRVVTVVLAAIAILLGIAIFWKHHAHAAVRRSRWAEKLWHVVEGLHAMGNSRSFYTSFAISLGFLALQVVPVYALMEGYGLNLGFAPAAAVLVILRVGSIVPQAPGNVGLFQLLTVRAVELFGVDRDTATGFATLLFVVITLPLWLAGFIALLATRMKITEIHREARSQQVVSGVTPPEPQA
jgi:uncharacterized protein (TIRG00374 family)